MFTKDLLDAFLASRASGINAKTIKLYHYALDRFIGYVLSAEGINGYLNSLTCGNGKDNYFRCLRTLFRWLYQNDYISSNLIEKVSAPRKQKRLMPAIKEEQIDILLEHCDDRDKAIISLLWHSGMRLSEAASVKAQDFNWDEGTVIVLGKGNKYRKCLAGDGIVKAWFEKHDTFERNAAGIKGFLWRLEKETGIKCNAHAFRRGFAVHQIKSGLSTRVVQALGGWENISMVEKYSKSLQFDDALKLYQKAQSQAL